MSRTFRKTLSSNRFRLTGNPVTIGKVTLGKVTDSNSHRSCKCDWCVSNRTISSKRQLERTDYELMNELMNEPSHDSLNEYDVAM